MKAHRYEVVEEVVIDTSPSEVWSVITEFQNYSQWNPGIRTIRTFGPLQKGNSGVIRFPLLGRSLVSVPIELLHVQENQLLEWQGRPRWLHPLVRGIHYHRLEPVAKSQTKLIHGEYFTGIAAPLAWLIFGAAYKQGYIRSTAAIKSAAEQRAASLHGAGATHHLNRQHGLN